MAMSRLIVEDAESALRDLYGLINPTDRHLADANLRTVEIAIHTLSNLVNEMREVGSAAYRVEQELIRAKKRSDEFQDA